MAWCKTCKEYELGEHVCSPQWQICIPECDGDDWQLIYAIDDESAARKAAEQYDQDGDYYIMRGGTVTVLVRPPGHATATTFRVSGESVPQYTAERLDREP